MHYLYYFLFFISLIAPKLSADNNWSEKEKTNKANQPFLNGKKSLSFSDNPTDQRIEEKIYPKEINPALKYTLLKLNKSVLTNLLLEKVVCKADQSTRVESFTYNGSRKKLTHLIKYKADSETKWTNEQRSTYTYDENDRRLSELNELWQRGSWQNSLLNTYAYDEHGNITVRSNESWDRINKKWNVNVRTHYEYDENNNPVTAVSQAWFPDLNKLLPFERQIYTYDGNNKILSILTEKYYWESETWIGERRRTYVYDNNGNLISDLTEDWNSHDNDWMNNKRISYTYDEKNNMLKKIIEKWENYLYEWIYYHKYTYTYDENSNLKTYIFEYWDDIAEEYIKIDRKIYSYNKNNMLTYKINEYWDDNQWIYDMKDSYVYDDNDKVITHLVEMWESDKWEKYHRLTYEYDADGNITNFKSRNWNSIDSSWYNYPDNCDIENNGEKYSFSCEELTAYYTTHLTSINTDNKILSQFSLSQNYPNPFNPLTTISYAIPVKTKVKILIDNTLGQIITTLVDKEQNRGNYKIRFDASRLPSGIYFYKIITDRYIKSKKMVLIK